MTYIISIFLILLCFIKKDSKQLFWLVLFWMWVLMAFNYTRSDYQMYIDLYGKYSTTTSLFDAEILFQYLCKIGGFFQLDYKVFYAIYSIFPILISGLAIKKTTQNISLVAACFMIFPFAIDAAQMRHFLAVSLVTYGSTFIINSNDNKNILKYLLFNFIAIGFHYSAAFFLFLPIAKKVKKSTLKRIITLLIIIELFMIFSNSLIQILGDYLPLKKLNAYFITDRWKTNFIGIFSVSIIQLMIFPIIYLAKKVYKQNCKLFKDYENKEKTELLDTIIKFDYIMLFLLPAYFYNVELLRIFSGVILLNYIGISIALYHRNIKNNIIVFFDLVGCTMLYFYFIIIHTNVINGTMIDLLNNNNLFN